jgi:hypothetical protein
VLLNSGFGRWWPIFALLAILAPFALVAIPPLTDVPGHTAAAAIEAARVGDPLLAYYRWRWSINLNMGGEVLMALLTPLLGVQRAGWAIAVMATGVWWPQAVWPQRGR